jgi:hypothetical protein
MALNTLFRNATKKPPVLEEKQQGTRQQASMRLCFCLQTTKVLSSVRLQQATVCFPQISQSMLSGTNEAHTHTICGQNVYLLKVKLVTFAVLRTINLNIFKGENIIFYRQTMKQILTP